MHREESRFFHLEGVGSFLMDEKLHEIAENENGVRMRYSERRKWVIETPAEKTQLFIRKKHPTKGIRLGSKREALHSDRKNAFKTKKNGQVCRINWRFIDSLCFLAKNWPLCIDNVIKMPYNLGISSQMTTITCKKLTKCVWIVEKSAKRKSSRSGSERGCSGLLFGQRQKIATMSSERNTDSIELWDKLSTMGKWRHRSEKRLRKNGKNDA